MRHYKSLRVDIWGLLQLIYLRYNKIKYKTKSKRILKIFSRLSVSRFNRQSIFFNRYLYRTDKQNPLAKAKKFNKLFISLRAIRFFYLTLKYKQFNKIANLAQKKDGYFESHFILALEGRVVSFLYRTGFVSNMLEALFFVKSSFITLNKKIVNYPNTVANLFSILAFHPIIKRKVFYDLIRRVVINKKSHFNPPRFLFVSYWFLFAYFIKYPSEDKLVFPHEFLDIYRAIKFAF